MAERSTAAVDVADNGGDAPLTATADEPTTDGTAEAGNTAGETSPGVDGKNTGLPAEPSAPDLHSGHKLAKRYRLEECVTRLDGFSSWRAMDEKLRRAVGVHLLSANHPRARPVLAAARSSALLGDPRFVQVLDAVEEGDFVYVVHEWLPDAVELTALLAAGPMEAHDAFQLVAQLSQAMAAAHREGLAHLRLTPGAVLRSSTGQYRIRGLAVDAALRGITAERPLRTDTEAIGALLYAALTQRWPYENDAYGLVGLPKGMGLIAPDQVRAGVHRGLSELAMRALVNDGATASRQEPPCTTPDELAKAVAAMPRILPPEPTFAAPPEYQRTTYQQGTYGRPSARLVQTAPVMAVPPAPLESRTGRALKWAVSALLIAALGLGSWQLAEALLDGKKDTGETDTTRTTDSDSTDKNVLVSGKPVTIVDADDFDPLGTDGGEKPELIKNLFDGDSATSWYTQTYYTAKFGGLKTGVGVVLDLGKVQQVGSVNVSFLGGTTSVELRTTEKASIPSMPDGFTTVADGSGTDVKLTPQHPVQARYLLVWLTELPGSGKDYRGKVTEIKVTG
ncbi:serine/threonine protein kinase [Streptomyces sp. NBC_01218]|uniref:serine/threonine protein kinase n=1 Tax=unclassified Streptomyces TaxID=2593676 RepID=UPI002E0FBB58|nr:serine/threonine protein kinase [Streptomyces sp. NBC_01218]